MRTVRRWLGETTGGLPGAFWYLWFGTLLNRLGNVAVLYLEIFLVARYHFSAGFAGLVIGLNGAGSAIGAMIGGVSADRFGRRPTLLIANLACAASTAALGFADRAAVIVVLATSYGIWSGVARPAFNAMMIDVLHESQRSRAMNLNYWAMNLGFAGAATLAGLLANAPRAMVFSFNAGMTAAAGLLIFLLVRESRPSPVAGHAVTSTKADGLRTVLTDGTFMTFVALTLGMWTVISTVVLMPITMLHRHLSPASYGSVIAVNGVLIVAGQLFVPRLTRERDRTTVLAVAALLIAVGFGAVALAPTVVTLGVTVAIWTLGEMLAAPSNATLTADLSPAHLRGRYQGVASLSYTASGFFAPIAGGFAIDHIGDAAVWIGGGVLGLLVVIGHLLTGSRRERRVTQLDEARNAVARQLDGSPPARREIVEQFATV